MFENVSAGHVLLLLLFALVIVAVRASGGRAKRIAELRAAIEERRNTVKDYPADHPARVLYAEEAEGAALEIRRLKASGGLIGKLPGILAVLVGLGAAWYGRSTDSSIALLGGAAMVLVGALLVLTA